MATIAARVVLTGIIFASAAFLSTAAKAQVLVETGILGTAKPRKDLGDVWDKAVNKEPVGAKPTTKTVTPTPAAAPAKPKVLPDSFSGETEDPMSILDINADVLTRFSAALAAEIARRGETPPLTRLKYDEIGATAGSFTPRQYFVLKARVRPFCEAVAAGQAPADNLTLSYMPTEAAAIRPRCAALLPSLKLNR